jgi:peroxiredoxin
MANERRGSNGINLTAVLPSRYNGRRLGSITGIHSLDAMEVSAMPRSLLVQLSLVLCVVFSQAAIAQDANVLDFLKVGDKAPDVEFQPLGTSENAGSEKIKLISLTEKGPVVLVVLRGWPGYQCPVCFRQMGELIGKKEELKQAGATVVLVYPGPADELRERAQEFLKDVALPEPFVMVVDPDYAFTNLYHLRWDEPRETAYPSTFVIGQDGRVVYRKTSSSHGDRAKADDVVEKVTMMHAATATGQEIPQGR